MATCGAYVVSLFPRDSSQPQVLIQMDSKGNVLIDRHAHARLTCYGLISFVLGPDPTYGRGIASATTWAAPEISKIGKATKEGDIFAFAMLAVEVCTRDVFV